MLRTIDKNSKSRRTICIEKARFVAELICVEIIVLTLAL
jgi:hypothetical protein